MLTSHVTENSFDFDAESLSAYSSMALFPDASGGADIGLSPMNDLTVSPVDLMNTSFGSEPPSGTLQYGTPLTPFLDYSVSPANPALNTNQDLSPLFGEKPVDDAFASLDMDRSLSGTSLSSGNGYSPGHAKRPSLSRVPHAHSSSSGITKARQRKPTKDLPPIPLDGLAAEDKKRAKNTLAARESRKKKAALIDTLESENKQQADLISILKQRLLENGYTGPELEASGVGDDGSLLP
jgi:general control protein GCN4